MAQKFSKSFYNSKAWKECRKAYIQSVTGLCETCLEKGRIEPGKILHHKTMLTPQNINDPYITLNWDNLIYECQDCHNQEGHGKEKKELLREGLMFDANGDLVKL